MKSDRPDRHAWDDVALGLHVLAELVAGSILLLQPRLFAADPDGVNHVEALRGIGNGALCVGVLGLCVFLSDRALRPQWAFATMALYHFGVVVLQLRHPLLGVPFWLAPLFHALLLARFAQAALRSERPERSPDKTKLK